MKKIKLNLGCGTDKKNGYINIDIDQETKPDLVHDLIKKLPFPGNSVEEILLQDVLEHLTKEDGQKLLNDCSRVLKEKGEIVIRIPNLSAVLKKFKHQDDLAMLYVYGDTARNKIHGLHKYGYSQQLIKEACQKAGIFVEKIEKSDTNFLVLGHKEYFSETIITLDNLLAIIFKTPIYILQNKKIIWKIDKNYPVLLAKIILKPLSRSVFSIICTSDTQKFVQNVLKYSHLKITIEDI